MMQKDTKEYIQLILLEMDTYSAHGLFAAARTKAKELSAVIRASDRIKNKQAYLAAVAKKIKSVDESARLFEASGTSARMSSKEQHRVKKLFSSSLSEGDASAVYQGAMALQVFGQYNGALTEFRKLIRNDTLRVAAAKNIIRCYVGLSALDKAVTQYRQWLQGGNFPSDQLKDVRFFLQVLLKKKGIKKNLPQPVVQARPQAPRVPKKKSIDILSIVIPYSDMYGKDQEAMLDVIFQKGNMISCIIPRDDQALVDYLQLGARLNHVQYNSTDVIFFDKGVVFGKNQLNVGANQGDYSVTLQMLIT